MWVAFHCDPISQTPYVVGILKTAQGTQLSVHNLVFSCLLMVLVNITQLCNTTYIHIYIYVTSLYNYFIHTCVYEHNYMYVCMYVCIDIVTTQTIHAYRTRPYVIFLVEHCISRRPDFKNVLCLSPSLPTFVVLGHKMSRIDQV